jgi:lipoate-protein ligase A
MIDGSKIVGSAQRRQRGALMQHGGILLAQSPHTPSLPGIRELRGVALAAPRLCTSITQSFARKTGWQLLETEWTSAERQHIEEVAAGKYAQDRWNRKR